MIAMSYSESLYKMPLIITRFANIYGPGQLNFTAIIPDAIRSCLQNKIFLVRSNGKAIRDFVYIDDIVDLYKLLSKNLFKNPKKFSGQIFNAGTNKKYKVKDILKIIFIHANKKVELKKLEKQMLGKKTTGELSFQFMDYQKLYKYLGWKPKYKLIDTMPKLFEWYKKYFRIK